MKIVAVNGYSVVKLYNSFTFIKMSVTFEPIIQFWCPSRNSTWQPTFWCSRDSFGIHFGIQKHLKLFALTYGFYHEFKYLAFIGIRYVKIKLHLKFKFWLDLRRAYFTIFYWMAYRVEMFVCTYVRDVTKQPVPGAVEISGKRTYS